MQACRNSERIVAFVFVDADPRNVERETPRGRSEEGRARGTTVAIANVDDLFVHPEWQGMGIGKRLLEVAERVDHDRGASEARRISTQSVQSVLQSVHIPSA